MPVAIALDAMGGDFLAIPNLQGAYNAIKAANSDLKIFLVGPQDRILGSLKEASEDPQIPQEFRIDIPTFEDYLNRGLLEVVDCSQIVEMGESPSSAIRQKKDSSLAKSFQLVKEGRAGAMVSAGNSGAVMAFGVAMLGRMGDVRRPAILCHFPAPDGITALLDAGANVDCTTEHLVQFAVMGNIYYQAIFQKKPRVALLNIGEEEGKGNEVVKATAQILRERMPDAYSGFIEGRDVFKGKADVIVCDGFVGNVVLKTAEGVAQVIKSTLKEEFSKNIIWGVGAWLARGGFSAMKSKMDYREYGAAPLVGLNGLGLIAHGSSDGKAIQNAVKMAARFVEQDLIGRLRPAFDRAPNGDVKEASQG